jgi:hypothetical protein
MHDNIKVKTEGVKNMPQEFLTHNPTDRRTALLEKMEKCEIAIKISVVNHMFYIEGMPFSVVMK